MNIMLSVDIAVILACARTRNIVIEILGDNDFLDLQKLDSKIVEMLLTIALHERIICEAERVISDIVNELDEEVRNRMYT